MKKIISLAAAAAFLFISCKKEDDMPGSGSNASVEAGKVTGNLQTRIVSNTLDFPWEILWGPDNKIWFTEREGRVKKIDPQTGQETLIATIADVASTTNFNGLLGMALHPDFSTTPHVFLVYNYFDAQGDYMQKVVRFTYDGTTLVAPMTIVDGIVGKEGGNFIHNGSRLQIGPDMKLYITTGDADQRFIFPQSESSLNGKVLRVNLDGSIPGDNPFGNAVWTTGHRNAQGLVFANNILYSSEHGETTNDEINIIQGGRNYGWPYVEGFCDLPAELTFCAENDVKEPLYAWTPTIAPSGMEYYNSNAIPQWKNSLLIAVLKEQMLIQMRLSANGTQTASVHEYFTGEFGRLRDVAVSPDGKVYISTDNGAEQDMIIEVSKKTGKR